MLLLVAVMGNRIFFKYNRTRTSTWGQYTVRFDTGTRRPDIPHTTQLTRLTRLDTQLDRCKFEACSSNFGTHKNLFHNETHEQRT